MATQIKSYRPSNGTEGAAFEATYCDRCTKQSETVTCSIWLAAFTDAPDYPPEWTYALDSEGAETPVCTAFHLDIIREAERERRLEEWRQYQQTVKFKATAFIRRWKWNLTRPFSITKLFLGIVWRDYETGKFSVKSGLDLRTTFEICKGLY